MSSAVRAVFILGLLLCLCLLGVNAGGDSRPPRGGHGGHDHDSSSSDCSSLSEPSVSVPSSNQESSSTGSVTPPSSSGSDCSSSEPSVPSSNQESSSTGTVTPPDSSSSSDCSSSSEPSVPSSNQESSSTGTVTPPDSSSCEPSVPSSNQESSSTGTVTPPDSSSSDDCSSSEPSVPSSNQESSSTGTVTPPSSSTGSDCGSDSDSGSEPSSSSSGSDDSSSSDCSSSEPSVPSSNQESSSSTGSVTPPDSSSDCGSEPSTGGNEESSSSSSGGSVTPPSGSEDCQRGTYSDNGFAPCRQCPNNTYANIRETSCTPCPDNMHAPVGAASLTECMCDDGYTSQWASGGPCYPIGDSPTYEWCGRGTYSSTGYGPDCQACGNNSYANIGETECHSCPDNMHAPQGAASLTECMCDDGYTSQWASGGPCYPIGDTPPQQGESNSTKSCSDYKCSDECNRDTKCQSIYGHSCKKNSWSFITCQDKSTSGVCAPSVSNGKGNSNSNGNSTCAVNSKGDRAWFATSCLPNGWTKAPVNKKCGSCCKPKHVPDGNGNIGGCTFVNNSACVTLEYRGECPSLDVLNVWRVKVINAIAESVSSALNVSKSDATISITINVLPSTNKGTQSCEVRLQVFPPKTGSLTANDFITAIWEQFNEHGDSLSAQSSSLSGVASYSTFGSLEPLDTNTDDIIINTSGAMTMATSSSAAAVTIGIITIAALL